MLLFNELHHLNKTTEDIFVSISTLCNFLRCNYIVLLYYTNSCKHAMIPFLSLPSDNQKTRRVAIFKCKVTSLFENDVLKMTLVSIFAEEYIHFMLAIRREVKTTGLHFKI